MKRYFEIRPIICLLACGPAALPVIAAHAIEGEATSRALPPASRSWRACYNGDFERLSESGMTETIAD